MNGCENCGDMYPVKGHKCPPRDESLAPPKRVILAESKVAPTRLFYQGMEIIPDEKPDVRDFHTFTELKEAFLHPVKGQVLKMTAAQMIVFQRLLLTPEELGGMMRV